MTPHGLYVLSAYAMTVLVLAGLALWLWLDARGRAHDLKMLEAAGERRRSARRQ